jgi:amino acid permease
MTYWNEDAKNAWEWEALLALTFTAINQFISIGTIFNKFNQLRANFWVNSIKLFVALVLFVIGIIILDGSNFIQGREVIPGCFVYIDQENC